MLWLSLAFCWTICLIVWLVWFFLSHTPISIISSQLCTKVKKKLDYFQFYNAFSIRLQEEALFLFESVLFQQDKIKNLQTYLVTIDIFAFLKFSLWWLKWEDIWSKSVKRGGTLSFFRCVSVWVMFYAASYLRCFLNRICFWKVLNNQ